ncbi:MAG TPA: MG2 domain-containing protein, partial [Calditrichia bacterium]|nr:MG2 domain-containing protein [Calditrichia bacterium]
AVSVPVYTALAQFYQQEGQAYASYQGDENLAKDHLKWYLQKARQLCQTAIERFPNAPQSANCRSLAAQLDQKNLGLTLESVNEPGEPFRALLTYQNVNKAWLRVVKLSPEAVIKKRYEEQLRHWDWVDFYRDQPRIQSWTVDLPVDGDLRLHKTEIALPELPNGFYAVLVASSADFSTNQEATGFAEFWASGMAMLYRQNQEDGENILTVYDRHSGAPLSGVKANIWYQDYDRGKRRNVLKTGPVLTSNAAGNIDLAPAGVANGNPRFMVDLKRGEERYFPWDMFSLGRPYRNLNRQVGRRAVFFTDRAIYRPGQTVYFKAILMENRPDAPALVTGHSTRVTLYDTNGQEVSALDLKSNDYGTISGSFVLPTGGLTGSFSLRNENGNASFRVEEYKRPRFEVTFPPVTGSFRLNEAVTVSGVAKSYAGANIDNARVRYRITRTVYYPYPFRGCWWGWWPQPSTVEILNGNTVSDAEGNFTIEFQALADPSIDPERQPAFNFSVEADVTDLAGETRSAQTSVRVGYVALEASLSIPAIIERGDAGSVGIVT